MELNNEFVFQLKVILKGSKPTIWRRLQIPGSIDLHDLHRVIQTAMGWSNLHLYRFEINGIQYGDCVLKYDFLGPRFEDARKAQLKKIVSYEKTRFSYEYDFGDGWEHEVIVEKILPARPGIAYPALLCGKQECPPEDCGGIRGYIELVESFPNPVVKEYGRMMEVHKPARTLK
jgi:hypothetical protein